MLYMHNNCISSWILVTNYYYYYYYCHIPQHGYYNNDHYLVQCFNTYSNKYSTSYYYSINHINTVYQKKQQTDRGKAQLLLRADYIMLYMHNKCISSLILVTTRLVKQYSYYQLIIVTTTFTNKQFKPPTKQTNREKTEVRVQ